MVGVGGEEAVHNGRQVGEADRGDQFARDALVLVGAAAEDDLVALFAADLDAHQADVADVVLRAGVRAAGDVQVDGCMIVEARVEMSGECDGVGLGVGRGEAAALIAGAGDGAAEHSACFEVQASSRGWPASRLRGWRWRCWA